MSVLRDRLSADTSLVVLAAGRLMQVVLSVASIRVMTEVLPSLEVGRVGMFQSVASFMSLLAIAPVTSYFQRRTIEWSAAGVLFRRLKDYLVYLLVIAMVAVCAALAVQIDGVRQVFPIEFAWLAWLLAGYVLFTSFHQTVAYLANSLGHRGLFVLLSNFALFLGLMVAVWLAGSIGIRAEWWLQGLMLGCLILLPFSVYAVYRIAKPSSLVRTNTVVPSFWSAEMLAFSVPLLLSNGFYWLQLNGYRFVLSSHAGVEVVGAFIVGFSVGVTPLAIFHKIALDYVIPKFYSEIADAEEGEVIAAWCRFVGDYWPVFTISALLLLAVLDSVAMILVADSFRQYVYLGVFGVIFQSFMIIYASYTQLLCGTLATKLLVAPKIVGGLTTVIATFVLAPMNAFLGTGAALVIGAMVSTAVAVAVAHRRYSVRLPLKRTGWAVVGGIVAIGVVLTLKSVMVPESLAEHMVVLACAGACWTIGLFWSSGRIFARPA